MSRGKITPFGNILEMHNFRYNPCLRIVGLRYTTIQMGMRHVWVFVKSRDPGILPGYDAPCTRLSSGWKIVFSVTCVHGACVQLDSH